MITGNVGDFSLSGKTCPSPTPVGLQVAQVSTLSAILIGVGGVVVGVFYHQVDRLRANLADSVRVREEIFRDTYDPAGDGHWRRKGFVQARPASTGETINTLEGANTAAEGDWIARGVDGEQWPIPGDEFVRRYTPADTVVPDGRAG